MANQRTIAKLLRAPTEGYEEAITLPLILAEQFELKHSLINMMTLDQFFGLEKDNPHDHIHWFNKITSTIKYKDVPNSAINLMLFPFSLAGAARWWLEKVPPCSIHTWEDLVSKFINEFFPSSRKTNLRNEILNFQQLFDESFHEAWDRYKDLLRACPQHEIAKLTHAVNQQTSPITTAMTAILKQFQATPPPASVKAAEEICVTCGGAHPYYQCLAAGGNTFPEHWDNIQGYVSTAAVNYNMANQIRPPALTQQNQIVPLNELEKAKRMNEANMKAMQTQINIVKNEMRNKMKNSIQASLSNQTNEIKNMMASLFQMNSASTSGSGSLPSNTVTNPKGELKSITTRSGLVLDGPTIPTPPPFINSEEDERVDETLTDPDLSKYTIKVPPPPVQKYKPPSQRDYILHQSVLKCKALADLAGIVRDVFILVGKFIFPADFVIVDYESDPRVPLILGRPFLRTARALINVHGEEMILLEGDERLTLNMRHDTSSYSNQPQKESINLINVFNDSKGGNVLPEKLLDLDSTKDLHPPLHVNPLSGSTTYSSSPNPLLEELADELTLITFPSKYDDDLQFDVESDLKEIEFLLHQDIDSSLKDSIDQSNLANPADNFVDSMPEMFIDEHALDYSSPLIFDEYDDDFLEVEFDTENVYDDPFDSKGEKIKESKLLIDELDLPRDFLPPFEIFPGLTLSPQPTMRTRRMYPGVLTDIFGSLTDTSGSVTDISGSVTDISKSVRDICGSLTDISGSLSDIYPRVLMDISEGLKIISEGLTDIFRGPDGYC
nr:reverse transcriptase domain-containing protein [Tanacetum cinerariifolium]